MRLLHARFLDAVGDGTCPENEDGRIELTGVRFTTDVDEFNKFVYPNIDNGRASTFNRALQTLRNVEVDSMNSFICDNLAGDYMSLFSTDALDVTNDAGSKLKKL